MLETLCLAQQSGVGQTDGLCLAEQRKERKTLTRAETHRKIRTDRRCYEVSPPPLPDFVGASATADFKTRGTEELEEDPDASRSLGASATADFKPRGTEEGEEDLDSSMSVGAA